MYQEFSVLQINTYLDKKQIEIVTNKYINKNNYDDVIITIIDRKNKSKITFDYEIIDTNLLITFLDDPKPNIDYILSVSNLESITEEKLSNNIKRSISFKSSVVSIVKILSPSMFEEVKKLEIKLKESADKEEDLINCFYCEIAKDNAFFNITNSFYINNKDCINISLKDHGQYFLRARSEKDKSNFGNWSEVVSFVNVTRKEEIKDMTEIPEIPDIEIDIDNENPEIDLSGFFKIEEYPQQGITPEEGLLIAFNNKINDLSVDEIIVIRKDVR